MCSSRYTFTITSIPTRLDFITNKSIMAEAVAGFYAVETVVEGAAAGALAVSGATVPLHARFQKIKSPSEQLALSGSTATIVKNKVYLIGGLNSDDDDKHGKMGIHVLSFPPDFGASRLEGTEPIDVDYELQKPEYTSETRPLENVSDNLVLQNSLSRDGTHRVSWSRVQHSTVAIDDKIYLLGGIYPTNSGSRASNSNNVMPLDTIIAYDTLKTGYTTLKADQSKCTEGIPESRYAASCTSSPYPPAASIAQGQGPSLDSHGTIFLHGGYDLAGSALHDTWTFDLGTKAWHKFPSIIDAALEDTSEPGQITYLEHRLWYVNGSTVMHLDLAEHDPAANESVSINQSTLSTGRVGSGQWQVVYPPPEQDPAATSDPKPTKANAPNAPTSSITPITTGSGRNYLLTLTPSNPQEMHLFQITSTSNTATSLKDIVRDKAASAISSLPDSWRSGKYEWSVVEVVQASMKEGEVERPDEGLSGFAVAGWEEYGDRMVLWGGQDGGGVKNEGWVVTLR